MKDMMGIVMADNSELRLNELTDLRSVPALPFGGRYRLIDFILSNMVNSGIINVGVATNINYSSLMDHLGSGAPWDLNRKIYGLFMLPPYVRGGVSDISAGSVDQLYGVLTFLRRSRQQYVLLASGRTVCNMTFDAALSQHIEKGADITVIYQDKKEKDEQLSRSTVYEVNEDGRVTGMETQPHFPKTTLQGMGMFIIGRLKLIELIEDAYARGSHDFVRDLLRNSLKTLNVFGYEYKGFVGTVDSVRSYYEVNMKMLDADVRKEIFGSENRIYTKVKDQVPTQYKESAQISDSLIADGCVIEGTVENSIIFRGVHIAKGAVVKNSIVMQNSVIEENCDIENTIIDKECTLRASKRLVGQPNYPVILPKRTLL